MPSVPIEMPSDTVMVLKTTALAPAASTPAAAAAASRSMCMLHGVTWLQVEQMPICGLAKSALVKPTACSIARPAARDGPSTTAAENRREDGVDGPRRRMRGGTVSSGVPDAAPPAAAIRLDVWLDVACLFRTRSEAQKACRTGKIEVNGAVAKPHRELRVGDRLRIGRPLGRTQVVVVRGLADRHIAKAEARALYDDETPPPTAEEVAMRRLERVFRATMAPRQRPDKRERRLLRGMKGG